MLISNGVPRFSNNRHFPNVLWQGSWSRGCSSMSGLQETQGFPSVSIGFSIDSEAPSRGPFESSSSGPGG